MSLQLKNIRSKWYSALSGILFLVLASCSAPKEKVDLIVHNTTIYTVDSAFSTAQCFAVKDGKFVAVGTDTEIMNKYEAAETIDAAGKYVYPGFIDSHCHFYGYGKGLQELDLTGTKSFDEVLKKLTAYVKKQSWYSAGDDHVASWIIGRGWDQNDWTDKEFPDRYKLDKLFPHIPIFLERIDGHAALANAEALRRAGINSETKIKGGVIEIDMITEENGGEFEWMSESLGKEVKHMNYPALMPSGILVDNAVDLVKKVIPKPTKDNIKQSLLAAQSQCFAVGLTTVDDAGLEKDIIDNMDALQKSGELKMRIYAMLTDNKENADHYLKSGPYKTDRLNVRSFKFYADGALGSRGACLHQPYSDMPHQSGFLLNTPEHFDSAAVKLVNAGFQMNTHCIGDSAVSLICKIYTAAISKRLLMESQIPSNVQLRWRIEHFQVMSPGDLLYLNQGYIIPSVQPTHATSDMYWAEQRLGKERIKYAYAYNDLLKATGKIALGTDFPVENINPLYTFYAAVARQDLKDFPEGGFQPENALSRENTLRGMTSWGAYANFEEKAKGSIEAGKFADFVLLDHDIMKCEIHEVPQTKVKATYINGEKVYEMK